MSQLSELVDGIDEYVKQPGQWRRKGENGPPIVTDPDGIAVKSGPRAGQVWLHTYSRPSSFGKQVENVFNLEKWKQRQGVIGMFLEPQLLDQMAALWVEDDHDRKEWKKAVDGVYVKASRAAGAMVAADRGTHGHNLTEDHDLDRSIITRLERGEDLGLGIPLQHAVVDAWQQLIAEHFEVLAVEAACVFDDWRVAGTLDRIVRVKHDLEFVLIAATKRTEAKAVTIPAGTVIVLDIKTGGLKVDSADRPNYWHSYAVQVAAYANSVPYDVDTERRGAWAWDVSTEHAVIAHIDIGGALDTDVVTAQLVYVDLAAGRAAGELVTRCKVWQKRKDIFSPTGHYMTAVTVAAPPVSPAGEGIALTSPAAPTTEEPCPSLNTSEKSSTSSPTTTTEKLTSTPSSPVSNDMTRSSNSSEPLSSTIPSSSSKPPTTPSRADLITRAKTLIEAKLGLALAQVWPADIPGFKGDHPHTADELIRIRAAIHEVELEHGITQPAAGFTDADMTNPTPPPWDEQRRRAAIRRARLAWNDYWAEDVIADILNTVTGEAIPSVDIAIDALTIDEAEHLAALADTLNGGACLEHNGDRWVVTTQPKEHAT